MSPMGWKTVMLLYKALASTRGDKRLVEHRRRDLRGGGDREASIVKLGILRVRSANPKAPEITRVKAISANQARGHGASNESPRKEH